MAPSQAQAQARADAIASVCLSAYASLPAGGARPTVLSNGRREWTILSGIVLSVEDRYIPIALGTGLKCEPYVRLSRTGDVLHDSHAEVLTRRAARRWLIHRLREEKTASLSDSSIPLLFEPADSGKYRLRGSIDLHWYISALPCGGASSCLLAFQRAAQDVEAGRLSLTPQALLDVYESTSSSSESAGGLYRGRANLNANALRTKPGRPDAPPAISMSCTDKLAFWSAVGIQGSLGSFLLEPVRPASLVLSDASLREIFPNEPQLGRLKGIMAEQCRRAIARVEFSSLPFPDAREQLPESEGTPARASLLACPTAPVVVENLVGGIRMGAPRRLPLGPKARSCVSKLEYFRDVCGEQETASYFDAKARSVEYRKAKALLRGDVPASVEAFLARAGETDIARGEDKPGAVRDSGPPYGAWLIAGRPFENFDVYGQIQT